LYGYTFFFSIILPVLLTAERFWQLELSFGTVPQVMHFQAVSELQTGPPRPCHVSSKGVTVVLKL